MSERKMLISEEGIEKLKQAELNHYGHSVYFKDNFLDSFSWQHVFSFSTIATCVFIFHFAS